MPGLHEPTGLARLSQLVWFPLRVHSETRRAKTQTSHIKGDLPQKTAGNLQPATGRTDTRAVSDLTTTSGYALATSPPQQKQQGKTTVATTLVLETDGHSTRSMTNRSIHSSVTTVCTDTAVGIESVATHTSLPRSELSLAGSSPDAKPSEHNTSRSMTNLSIHFSDTTVVTDIAVSSTSGPTLMSQPEDFHRPFPFPNPQHPENQSSSTFLTSMLSQILLSVAHPDLR